MAGTTGGGLYVYGGGGASSVVNSIFARNRAGVGSGAALHFFNSDGLAGTATILHTTVVSPTMANGIGIYAGAGAVNLTDTIVSSYKTGIGKGPSASFTSDYNLFFQADTALPTGSHSIVGLDPAFVNPAADDYHLTDASPAADRGLDVGVTVDYDGNPRPRFGGPDIGAYELQTQQAADLSISQSASELKPIIGQEVAFALHVANAGPGTATNLVVTDTLPVGLNPISAAGAGWACTLAGRSYTCRMAKLGPGATGDLTVRATVTVVQGTLVNTAEVRSDLPDRQPGNNSATASLLVEPIRVSFTTGALQASETAGSVAIAIVLSRAPILPVTVSYSVGGGTATASGPYADYTPDYTGTAASIVFAAGHTVVNRSVTLVKDDWDEPNEWVGLTLSSPQNALLGGHATAQLTILDANPLPTVKLDKEIPAFGEADGTGHIRLVMEGGSEQTVTVRYALEGGTATPGADFLGRGGTASFAPHVTLATIDVPIVDDGVYEAITETVGVRLSDPVNAQATAGGIGMVIVDRQSPPTIWFDRLDYSGYENAATIPVTLTLSGRSELPVSVRVSDLPGVAQPGVDYRPVNDVAVFAPGVISTVIYVRPIDDASADGSKAFQLTLSDAVNGALTIRRFLPTVTILDDDVPAARFAVSAVTVPERQAASPGDWDYAAPIRLASPAAFPVSLRVRVFGGTATQDVDYSAPEYQTVTFAPGTTEAFARVTIRDDTRYEPEETVWATLVPDPGTVLGVPKSLTIKIQDNDPRPPSDLNLTAWALEVTQGVQDLNNSVPLVAGRRTFVRLHVYEAFHSGYRADGHLNLYCQGETQQREIQPMHLGSNGLAVWRHSSDHYPRSDPTKSFLFEVPSECTQGTLRLEGFVHFAGWLPENNLDDNVLETNVTFTESNMHTYVYEISYDNHCKWVSPLHPLHPFHPLQPLHLLHLPAWSASARTPTQTLPVRSASGCARPCPSASSRWTPEPNPSTGPSWNARGCPVAAMGRPSSRSCIS